MAEPIQTEPTGASLDPDAGKSSITLPEVTVTPEPSQPNPNAVASSGESPTAAPGEGGGFLSALNPIGTAHAEPFKLISDQFREKREAERAQAVQQPQMPVEQTPGNNPGNLRVPGGGPGSPFQQFATPEQGIAAIANQLQMYGQGSPATGGRPLTTIAGIVSHYSPPTENDTGALIARASAHLGVDPNQPINLQDPATMRAMVEATLLNEHGGRMPVDQAALDAGMAMARQGPAPPQVPPAPQITSHLQLPDYNQQALPAGIMPGSSRNPRYDASFEAMHSADLNPLREFWYQFGMGGLGTLADLAGIPGNIEHLGPYLGGGRTNYRPYEWSAALQGELPTSSQLKRRLGQALSFDYDNPPATNDIGRLGTAAGQTVAGSALPTAALLGIGRSGLMRVGGGLMDQSLNAAAANPLAYAAKEGLEFPFFAGLGAGEAGNIYRGVTGDDNSALAEILGGLATSVRIPLLTSVLGLGSKMVQRATGLMRDPLGGIGGMSTADAQQVMGQALRDHLTEALDRAKDEVTGIVPTNPATAGLSGATLNAAISDAFHAEAARALGDGVQMEKMLWSPAAGVNMNLGRNAGKTLALRKQLEADFAEQTELGNRDPADYPKNAIDKIFDGKWGRGPDQAGLTDAASLQQMQNTRSRLEAAIREEQAKDVPNRSAIGTMRKLSRSLLDDMTATGINGMAPAEVQAFQKAMAFSKQLAELRETPEIDAILSAPKSDIGRLQTVATLDRFMREGTPGAAAARSVSELAKLRSNGDPMALHQLISDGIRQKFLEQVAPNGYVNMQAYQRFMSPQKFGPWLERPEYADVAHQVSRAALGEQNAIEALSLGKDKMASAGSSYNAEQARASATQLWLDNPVDQVFSHIDRSPNQYRSSKAVFDQLDRDPTGQAAQGFSRMIGDRAAANGASGLAQWAEQNPGLVKALSERDPLFAGRLKDLTSVTSKAGITAQLTDLALRWAGARVGGLTSHETGSSFVMAAAGSRFARQVFANLTPGTSREMMGVLLTNNDAYNHFVKASGGSLNDLHLLHAYVPGMPLGIGLEAGGVDQPQQGQNPQQQPAQNKPSGP